MGKCRECHWEDGRHDAYCSKTKLAGARLMERRRAPLPPLGGVSWGPGEILISICDLEDAATFAGLFGPGDGFTREISEAAARAFPQSLED